MPEVDPELVRQKLAEIYQSQSRRVFATLIRLLGDMDLAEEALHDAFMSAAQQWATSGIPDNPRAWLVSAGRFKAIDTIRRRVRFDASLQDLAGRVDDLAQEAAAGADEEIEDDRLRLVFTCCHPALSPEAQLALTLREVCGLKTEEIAAAFLTTPATIAQRIVRGKSKIRDASIPYQLPELSELPDRLDSVLAVIYLVFNEGYAASSGDTLTRPDLSQEAIRLGRLLCQLLPDPEAIGLLALMLLHESRRTARATSDGEIVLLEDQDRTRWDREHIREGTSLVEQAQATGRFGLYTIQAAISAVHAQAESAAATDWARITRLYDLLARIAPSPVVDLNRAVAVAMRDGPQAGIELIDAILAGGKLADYHLIHAARADLCRRLGKTAEAHASYAKALLLAKQEPERRFLTKRLAEVS